MYQPKQVEKYKQKFEKTLLGISKFPQAINL
jgi:hypothetical protein